LDGQSRQVRYDQVHLRTDADHAEHVSLFDLFADGRVDVDSVYGAAADLHDVPRGFLAANPPAPAAHRTVVLRHVRTVGVDRQLPPDAPPMHRTHVQVLALRRVLFLVGE